MPIELNFNLFMYFRLDYGVLKNNLFMYFRLPET